MSARARLIVAFVSTSLMVYIGIGAFLGPVMGDTTYGQLSVFNEVIRLVLDGYVEPVNLDRAMAGADLGLTEALDGDSAYLDADEFKNYQQGAKDSDADLGLVLTRRFGYLMVVSPRPGSPGAKAGLKPGDILKTIDGRHSRPLAVPVGERLLRGAPGSVVKLKILRAGSDPFDLSVVRERLQSAPPERKVLPDGSGYLKVGEFTPRVAEEVRGDLDALRRDGARKLILDLRGASFGLPAEGVRVAELFLKGGVVTRLAGKKAAEQILSADPSRSDWELPLVVLVDTGTSGAGEIVAAALQESGKTLVGEHTFGRAGVQKAYPLAEGAVVLTVSKYLSPKGNAIHGKGLEPTVVVEAPSEDSGSVAPRDAILEKGLEILNAPARKAA
jgi:carboxyl-terminal processing protease